ncbi:MAG: class I SAM-dependent methyltransferase [Deltaproteobacteria bacterium]|nr:class I SAM-dependent methyltransferase [Deltaproteobacteria bacterium]
MSHFNRSAATWDTPQKIQMMDTLAGHTIHALAKRLNSENRLDMVDFGCGTGLFGLAFADFAKTLTGIDTSEAMLDVFNHKTAKQPNIQSFLLDFEQPDTPLPGIDADLILSAMAFHHLKAPETVLGRLKALLKPNGVIAIVDLDKEDGTFHPNNDEMGVKHFGFSKEAVEKWATSNNLSLDYSIIHTFQKNDKSYPIFLAVMTPVQ